MGGQAYIAGAFEHPGRYLPEVSLAELHAEVALGALADAGADRQSLVSLEVMKKMC